MSAWMISDAHADFLVTAYLKMIDGTADPQAIGQALLYENCASLAARYGDNDTSQADEYRFRYWAGPIEPANVNKQARCADYQCCEHRAWEESQSAAILRALVDVTGGQDAALSDAFPWGLDDHAEPVEVVASFHPAPVISRGTLAQVVALRATSPLRPATARVHDVDGLALFDHARQPRLF